MAAGLETNKPNEADVMRFDVIPDDVLLDIFNFYMGPSPYHKKDVEAWQTLVHVCRRWRILVFGSPRHLDLRLVCAPKTRTTRDTLDIWPALPLVVQGDMDITTVTPGTDKIIAALGHSNRVCEVDLTLQGPKVGQVLATMQVPFPELTKMWLNKDDPRLTLPVIPDSFLGGSAPRLRYIYFNGIPFPGLPKLLSSATHLVRLWLSDIPPSGYFSPEAIVATLSVLSSLEELHLRFQSRLSRPDWETRRPPSPTRSISPALEHFSFSGIPEYLEDLVSSIDTPQLGELRIELFDQVDIDFERLAQFINRTPKHRRLDNARIRFGLRSAEVLFGILHILILCRQPDRGPSFITQFYNSLIPSAVEDLYIERGIPDEDWNSDAIGNTSWTRLLLPFTAVKNLYLSKEFSSSIAAVLQELAPAGRATDVLPNLQNIFVDDFEASFKQNIGQFIVARQRSGHRIAISTWNEESRNPDHVP